MGKWLIEGLYTIAELACRCLNPDCGAGASRSDWRATTLEFLEIRRRIIGRPSNPTSGFRCTDHNRESGGVSNSAHKRGALDERATNGRERFESVFASFLTWLVLNEFLDELDAIDALETATNGEGTPLGIGVARGFVHTDDDLELIRPALWIY